MECIQGVTLFDGMSICSVALFVVDALQEQMPTFKKRSFLNHEAGKREKEMRWEKMEAYIVGETLRIDIVDLGRP